MQWAACFNTEGTENAEKKRDRRRESRSVAQNDAEETKVCCRGWNLRDYGSNQKGMVTVRWVETGLPFWRAGS